ncbi:TMS membrane protein [Cavenderia fasciculata]|uniref:TMS membrane protein n=1 Tax=Cavenderia fasciculata TaxID=261658 RepID=F4PVI0_CACFS|nr:TMS membrane protein [Cavenderia fasciculata]EGG19994.1 TMS membrane protein [Cavenderia fasciculata]|eukprot:XP_004366977.1 TMS membrane protein [Cavenderia fasciculata]
MDDIYIISIAIEDTVERKKRKTSYHVWHISCSCCGSVLSLKKSTCTRTFYWAFSWFADIDVLQICSKQDNECYGALVVYRLTFGLAVYHILLALILIGVKNTENPRAQIQDGYWPVKIVLLAGIIFASFFIPNQFFVYYGWISLFGAAAFILIQLVLLIEFGYTLNEKLVSKIEDEGHSSNRYYIVLLVASIGTICLALALTITMLVLWGKTCSINQFFVVFNLGLSLIIGVLSVNERIREYRPSSGLLQSGVVMLYSTYLVYSAIMSEPASTCSTMANQDPKNYTVIMGAIFTIISVCYSAFRASDSTELLGKSDSPQYSSLNAFSDDDDDVPQQMEDDEKHEVAYSYTFFHITFAFGAMYIGMLLTNWSTIGGLSSASINVDSGLVSVWVKIVSGWLVHLLYLWTLVGPALFPNRSWD